MDVGSAQKKADNKLYKELRIVFVPIIVIMVVIGLVIGLAGLIWSSSSSVLSWYGGGCGAVLLALFYWMTRGRYYGNEHYHGP